MKTPSLNSSSEISHLEAMKIRKLHLLKEMNGAFEVQKYPHLYHWLFCFHLPDIPNQGTISLIHEQKYHFFSSFAFPMAKQ